MIVEKIKKIYNKNVDEIYYIDDVEAFIIKNGLEYSLWVNKNDGSLEQFGPESKIFKRKEGFDKIYDRVVEEFMNS